MYGLMKRVVLITIAILLILIVPASAMQIGYLSSNTTQDEYIMYKGSLPTHSGKKTVTITQRAIWVANESAKVNITFPENEWTLVLFAKGKDSGKIRISIGVWNGNSFESYGNTILTLSNGLQSYSRTISTTDFIVPKGCRLALQVECIDGTIELHIKKDKEFSKLIYPLDEPPYPVSELLPVVLMSVGLALMAIHRNVR